MPISRDLLTTHITDTTDVLAVNSEISSLGGGRYIAALEFDHDEYNARRGTSGTIAISTSLNVHVTKPNFEKDGNVHHSKRDNFTIPSGAIVKRAWSHIGALFTPGSLVLTPRIINDGLGATSALAAGTVTNHTAGISSSVMPTDAEVYLQLTVGTTWITGSLTLFIEYLYTDTVSPTA